MKILIAILLTLSMISCSDLSYITESTGTIVNIETASKPGMAIVTVSYRLAGNDNAGSITRRYLMGDTVKIEQKVQVR